MGLFSGLFPSSTRTDVSTSIQRIIEDKLLPDSIKKGTITAILQDGSIPEYVNEECIQSIATSAERMYSYGLDRYDFGIPQAELHLVSQKDDALLEVLKRQHASGDVNIVYSHYGPPNFPHVGWVKLVEDHEYNPTTNVIGKLSTTTKQVFLSDMILVFPSVDQFKSYSPAITTMYGPAPSAGPYPNKPTVVTALGDLTSPSGTQIDSSATEIHLLVSYAWEEEETYTMPGVTQTYTRKVVKTGSMKILPTGYKTTEHFQVRYTSSGQTYFFLYEFGSGEYPTLDSAFDEPTKKEMGKFFPFGYVRYEKHSAHEYPDTPEYKTSKRLFKYMNMDLDSVSRAISENPDIAKVEQAILMMGIPANSTDQINLRYLFDFFNKLYYYLPVEYSKPLSSGLTTEADVPPTSSMVIVIKDKRFKLSLTTFGIQKRRRAGRIGKRGTYGSSKESVIPQDSPDANGFMAVVSVFTDKLVYRHQLTENMYEEVSVQGLQLQYHIWNDYYVSAGIGDDKLLIPLDYTITSKYPITYREDLYAKSMHFVFNAVVQTEVQWYETGAFQAVMLIIAIIITVYSYGADGGSSIATALGLSGTAGLIATIVVTIIIGMMMPSVYKLFVRTLGKDAANVLALIAVVYGGYKIASSGSVAGAPFAMDLIQFGLNLQQAVVKQEMLDLMTEAEDFQRWSTEQTNLLKQAQSLLDNQTLISPMVIFGESPQDFYNRTVHSGNIGIAGIDAVSMYVTSALTLPKLDETLGENNGF